MDPVVEWTGETACALQAALRMSNEAFADHLGIGVRTVASWHQKPGVSPRSVMQQILDTALQRATDDEKQRFRQLVNPEVDETALREAEHQVANDPNIDQSLEWLDRRTGWTTGTARRRVIERLAGTDVGELHARRRRRMEVSQSDIAAMLRRYYTMQSGYGVFHGHCGSTVLGTSILARTEWLGLNTALTAESDRLRLVNEELPMPEIDDFSGEQVVSRLAQALAMGTRIYDLPLYRLLSAEIDHGCLAGAVALDSFVEYALTLDLLESELVDHIAVNGHELTALPLRDRFLPDTEAVVDLKARMCAGGALALFAIARPATPHHSEDFLLLVQERSGHVLNSARRLSLTQGFHQPMIDYRVETRIALTLMRELEEEMFGREELDNTVSDSRRADPMHPTRLTRPMRWLTKTPERMRIEATGFGLNLVNGNYEFANLIVVEDERFWGKFGGDIEANWEAGSLRRYSTLDQELLQQLVSDPAWTNEGLFTLLLGLRRLSELDAARVRLPPVSWTLD